MRGPFFPLRYAQDTKTHSNAVYIEDLVFPNFLDAGEKKVWVGKLILWKRTNAMAESREVMNIRQASQYLGVSPDTLYKYVNEQKIPAFKLGNRWRFKKSKLDQWMEEKSTEAEPETKKKIKAAVKAAGTAVRREDRPAKCRRSTKRRTHVWNGSENDRWSGCGLLEHQGSGAQEDAYRNRSGAPRAGADRAGSRGRFHDRGLGHGFECDRQAVHRRPRSSRRRWPRP